jgi:hypothetical protein
MGFIASGGAPKVPREIEEPGFGFFGPATLGRAKRSPAPVGPTRSKDRALGRGGIAARGSVARVCAYSPLAPQPISRLLCSRSDSWLTPRVNSASGDPVLFLALATTLSVKPQSARQRPSWRESTARNLCYMHGLDKTLFSNLSVTRSRDEAHANTRWCRYHFRHTVRARHLGAGDGLAVPQGAQHRSIDLLSTAPARSSTRRRRRS